MLKRVRDVVSVAGLAVLVLFVQARAEEAQRLDKETKFLRFAEDDQGGGKLEAAIVTYANDKGAKVHLVSAVHIGERSYYEGLAKTFAGYDSLLYEMVKPKDAPAPRPGQRGDSMIAAFQLFLKDVLELEFQLDGIDYRAKNFVHADLDAETFERMQSERGENMFILLLRQMLHELEKPQQNVPEFDLAALAAALLSDDRARHLKLLLARQFEDIEAKVAGMEGPKGSVLVTERNKAAVAVLKARLEKGDKNIGVFYGAAHMGDIEKRVQEMGFKRAQTEWRTAWDMTAKEGDLIIKRVQKKKPETIEK